MREASRDKSLEHTRLVIYADGGVRQHQDKRRREGFAAYLAVKNGSEVVRNITSLGNTTIGKAEYVATIDALRWLQSLPDFPANVEIRSDSEFLVRQLNGEYRVRDPEISYLYEEVTRLKSLLRDRGISVRFVHVRREENIAGKMLEELRGQLAGIIPSTCRAKYSLFFPGEPLSAIRLFLAEFPPVSYSCQQKRCSSRSEGKV